MAKFELISTKRNTTLGIIECDSMMAAELFLAMNFPNDFFGANIKGVDCNSVVCIPIKAAFDTGTTPIDVALRNFDSNIKIRNDLCDVTEDREGILRSPYKQVKSENGKIVKSYDEPADKTHMLSELGTMLKNHGYWSNSSFYHSITRCVETAMRNMGDHTKAELKSELENILRNFGFYSKASIWVSVMSFVDRMYV